jgi:hypothetical protein
MEAQLYIEKLFIALNSNFIATRNGPDSTSLRSPYDSNQDVTMTWPGCSDLVQLGTAWYDPYGCQSAISAHTHSLFLWIPMNALFSGRGFDIGTIEGTEAGLYGEDPSGLVQILRSYTLALREYTNLCVDYVFIISNPY